jgi:ElaB/YqjD/DUF883 family membrane-anchored ribosome-binding protein
MAATDAHGNRADKADPEDQIRELREQVEILMRDRVTPVVADAVGRAGEAVRQVGESVTDKTDALAAKVREKPLTAILVALGAGYLIGRITR